MSGNLGGILGAGLNPSEYETERAGVGAGYSLLEDVPTEFVVELIELVDNKKTEGYMNAAVTYQSTDPENPGTLREWIVLTHPNETAVEIGLTKLSALAVSCGVTEEVTDTTQVQGKHCFLDVATREREDKPGSFNNQVGRYIPADEWRASRPVRQAKVAAAVSPAPTSPSAPAGGAASGQPWANGQS